MDIKVREGFVINPTIEMAPAIRISPFMECDLGAKSGEALNALAYLNNRFGNYCLTIKAREAIKAALSFYHLREDDEVAIFTTSSNSYVSGCVTRAIEAFCKWSREVTSKTKVILVIHEFGYPCQYMAEVLKYGLPVIEDCALSFVSQDVDKRVGRYGDFAIYSFSKFFPMQIGGLLVSNKFDLKYAPCQVSLAEKNFILQTLALHISKIDEMMRRQIDNYHYLETHLYDLGISSFFPLKEGICPAVYLFTWHEYIDYPLLKEYIQRNGIEASVFYGKNAFFVPCHNRLSEYQLDYIITLLKHFYS
ncbi:DegT/DnrJ/EryC1/StrS family aminotransferase [Parabacteroides sp.]|uniref:DegT/DnrJ/EryC1/StrS family aminotransferase n=1 Tax=Parabacteroides sp. TaxID=1869337 RepID=UPI00257E54EA|nr:DegT/DnrJ/EryC1/StrS family aminotransferase [Parabacteroides sp.]